MNKSRWSRAVRVLAVAVAVMMVFAACGSSGGNTANSGGKGGSGGQANSKNPYGFASEYEESAKEEEQLKNFPKTNEELLALEKALTENGVAIEKIEFDGWNGVPSATFRLGKMEDGNYTASDFVYMDYNKDKNSGEISLYSIESKLYNSSKLSGVSKAMLSVIGISDIEVQLAEKLQSGEDMQTSQYLISRYDGKSELRPDMAKVKTDSFEEFEKIYQQVKAYPYIEFEIYSHPAENERQTALYKYNREQRKPAAGGRNIDEYGLSFNIPSAMKTNPYSGMLAVWEYYTGEYDGSGYANGIDLSMTATSLNGKDLQTYINNDSRPAHSSGVTPFEAKVINGVTWYTCNNGRIYYYAAEFAGRVYELEVRYTSVVDGVTLEETLGLLDQTLFFE